MMSNRERILFVPHRATRTGAPIVLLHLLRWLKRNSPFHCDVLFRKGGELESEIAAAAEESYFWPQEQPRGLSDHASGPARESRPSHSLAARELLDRLRANDYRLVYANSIICCRLLPDLRDALRTPSIVHVHEMESLIALTCDEPTLTEIVPYISRFIAVSDLVAKNLIENHAIPAARIERIPAFVERVMPTTREVATLREELAIPPHAFLVGGSGTLGLRKGTDLFIAVARRVAALTTKPIHFLWLGGKKSDRAWIEFHEDLRKLDIEGLVHFTGTRDNPQDYFHALDLFLMTSREDPFPLVCLENARAGNPILCFEKGSGCTEFVDEACGHVSPYLDVDDMAGAVIDFATHPARCSEASRAIRQRLAPYTVEQCAPQILSLIEDLIS
jgi:glycosyltransferase involved in cell wall biosynthesis